jgi:amino acid adenylation domain-containing protein
MNRRYARFALDSDCHGSPSIGITVAYRFLQKPRLTMVVISHPRILPHYLEATAGGRGDHVALIEGDRTVSYSELRASAFKMATRLLQDGVGRGDRVVLLVTNCIEFVVAFWAIQYIGAVAVPLNPDIRAAKLRWIVSDCMPSALVVDASIWSRSTGQAICSPAIPVLTLRDNEPAVLPSAPDAISRLPEWAVGSVAIDQDLACIIYTSGSTGTAKGVMLSHLNMVAASSSVAGYLNLANDDRVFCAIPFSFDYGLHQITMATLVGATLIVESSFAQPLMSLHRLVKHGATVFPLVPTMVSLIEPLARRFDLDRIRTITSTAAALHPNAIDRLQEVFKNARIFSMYGLTECHRCTYLDPDELPYRKSSVGKAIPNTELWVVDKKKKRHDRGATGELVIRGSTVMRGYWNNSVDTSKKLRPGPVPGEMVLYTGDICMIDNDGFVSFVCRKDDVLKVKGQKVAPKEVEQALMQHPDVTEAAVIGIPHHNLGDEIVAFVSLREESIGDSPALRKWCTLHLEPLMVPSRFEVLDALPKSPNGKIDKLALQKRCQRKTPMDNDGDPCPQSCCSKSSTASSSPRMASRC